MEAIIRKSFDLALDEATLLWGMTSTAYPKGHDLVINTLAVKMLEMVSSFALNCRIKLSWGCILPRSVEYWI